jgi:hypothetical protein
VNPDVAEYDTGKVATIIDGSTGTLAQARIDA